MNNLITECKVCLSVKTTSSLVNSMLLPFFLVFTLFFFSCSENNPKMDNVGDNNLSNIDNEVNLIINSIDKFITQMNNLPRANQGLSKIDTGPLTLREDLASSTLRELNDLSSQLNADKAKEINLKFQDLLKQWTNAVTDFKYKLRDYESLQNELKKTSNNTQDESLSNSMWKNLNSESRISKKTSDIYTISSKVDELEQKLRYFTREYYIPKFE